MAKWQVTSLVNNQLHSSEGSINGERDFHFRRRVDLNSTACTSNREHQKPPNGDHLVIVCRTFILLRKRSRASSATSSIFSHNLTTGYDALKHYHAIGYSFRPTVAPNPIRRTAGHIKAVHLRTIYFESGLTYLSLLTCSS